MPRSNRRRPHSADASFERLITGWKRSELRRGVEWIVQPVSASQALKPYRCPGCEIEIAPRVAHVVAWRADGVLGAEADLAARRHWHTHCWRIS